MDMNMHVEMDMGMNACVQGCMQAPMRCSRSKTDTCVMNMNMNTATECLCEQHQP
jgi:hypothetical protein